MPKAPDFIDIHPPEPNLAEPSRELEPEFEPNSTQTLPEFPCTRVEAGKALGVSDVSIGKWIKKIREAGVTILEGDRITVDGFQILEEYQQAKNKVAFLSQLETTQPVPEPALVHVPSTPFGLTVKTKASQRVEVLRGELATLEGEANEDFGDYLAIAAEIVMEDEAADEQDDLEWQMLRKQNARKWLKRRAILERDKQQILQGDVLPELKKQ